MTTQWHEGLLALPSAFKKSVFSVSTKTPSSFNLVLFQPVSFINVACLAPGGILACDLYYKQIFYKVYSAEVWSLINLVRKHYVQPLPNGIDPRMRQFSVAKPFPVQSLMVHRSAGQASPTNTKCLFYFYSPTLGCLKSTCALFMKQR